MSEKANRLDGFLQTKGEAERPPAEDTTARTMTATAAPAPPAETEQELLPPQRMGMGVKSLTLRLPEDEYQRLRLYAFKNNTTHQEVLAFALKAFLKRVKA